jgi:hypothetical protein
VSPERWPNESAPYEFFATSDEQGERWQTAIRQSLADETLAWRATQDPDEWVLAGDCPRCDHHMEDLVKFRWVGVRPVEVIPVNITCNCVAKTHNEQPDGERGCGWAPALTVYLAEPSAGG